MPKTYNTAAKSTRKMASKRRYQGNLTGLIAIVAILVIYLLLTNSKQFGIGGMALFGLLFLLRFIPDLFDNYSRRQEKLVRRADRGARAEEEVADILGGLDDSFIVLHDIDSPYGNIDHIVISQKGGVILLETKSHHGTVTTNDSEILVNGHSPEKNFASQALSNSLWLRDEIEKLLQVKPWVTSFVVFTNAFVKYDKPVKGVRAINRKFLLQSLQAMQSRNATNAPIWEHRERIVKFLNGQKEMAEEQAEIPDQMCPKCGKSLKIRVAKRGDNVGRSFWVCPDYPQCQTAILIENSI